MKSHPVIELRNPGQKKTDVLIFAAWPSGQGVGLEIRRSWVRIPLWPLAGFVLGRPELKFSARLVNIRLVASCQLGFLIRYVVSEIYVSKYLRRVPVN